MPTAKQAELAIDPALHVLTVEGRLAPGVTHPLESICSKAYADVGLSELAGQLSYIALYCPGDVWMLVRPLKLAGLPCACVWMLVRPLKLAGLP